MISDDEFLHEYIQSTISTYHVLHFFSSLFQIHCLRPLASFRRRLVVYKREQAHFDLFITLLVHWLTKLNHVNKLLLDRFANDHEVLENFTRTGKLCLDQLGSTHAWT